MSFAIISAVKSSYSKTLNTKPSGFLAVGLGGGGHDSTTTTYIITTRMSNSEAYIVLGAREIGAKK